MHDTTKIDEQTMQGNHDDHLSSEVMSLALDGLLSPGELREFDQHLHSCVACSVRWTKWQQISRLLEVEPFMGPAPGFVLRVDQGLRQQERRRERMVGGVVLVGGTVSIWSILLLGVVLTTVVWLVATPAARLELIQYLAFGGQFLALGLRNLAAIRDAALEVLPGPGLALAICAVLTVALFVWIRLVFSGDTRRSEMSNGTGQGSRQADGNGLTGR